ncbi:RidA family protein [uncultured Roseibium sp.]|uniref:RidA family protein n=1 Tax=uncultured Roseibium sp. TaxID=1936171 RepID=UPI00262530AF|nr:RidA family protein [uncultured Roseibium sp.]
MNFIPINPTKDIYQATPDYIHAIAVDAPQRLLFVSGTMGLDTDGTPAETLDSQLQLIWRNISTILQDAGGDIDNVVRVTSYLRHRDYMTANQDARVSALGGRVVPCTTIVAETLSEDWLVEVEVIAAL